MFSGSLKPYRSFATNISRINTPIRAVTAHALDKVMQELELRLDVFRVINGSYVKNL
jgi:hypothetical protein